MVRARADGTCVIMTSSGHSPQFFCFIPRPRFGIHWILYEFSFPICLLNPFCFSVYLVSFTGVQGGYLSPSLLAVQVFLLERSDYINHLLSINLVFTVWLLSYNFLGPKLWLVLSVGSCGIGEMKQLAQARPGRTRAKMWEQACLLPELLFPPSTMAPSPSPTPSGSPPSSPHLPLGSLLQPFTPFSLSYLVQTAPSWSLYPVCLD